MSHEYNWHRIDIVEQNVCSGLRHRKTEEDGQMNIQGEYMPRRNGREQDCEKGPSSLRVGDALVLKLKVI